MSMKKVSLQEENLRVEHSTFTPLVYSPLRGGEWQGCMSVIIHKRLDSLLAGKWDQTYSFTPCWAHSQLSFSLLHLAIPLFCRAPSSYSHAIISPPSIDLVNADEQFCLSWLVWSTHLNYVCMVYILAMLGIRENKLIIKFLHYRYLHCTINILLPFLAWLCMFCLE